MSNTYNVPKRERREQAREHARTLREAEEKKRRRNRVFVQGGVIVGVIAIAAVALMVVTNLTRPEGPGPLNMASDGILFDSTASAAMSPVKTAALAASATPVATPQEKTGPVSIVVYADYQCPFCAQFEQTNGKQIVTWVAGGIATLEMHPVALLDGASLGTRYSSRAANAVACVANYQPDDFYLASTALFASQPAEQTRGLKNDEIVKIVEKSGADDPAIAQCIRDESFKSWVTAATLRTRQPLPNSDEPYLSSTPTVLVNGVRYPGSPGDAAAFLQFVGSISDAANPKATPEG
ncbi:MAG: DsbA family protein [Microbacteriaceae bacterium]